MERQDHDEKDYESVRIENHLALRAMSIPATIRRDVPISVEIRRAGIAG